jgi:hypothetical protein
MGDAIAPGTAPTQDYRISPRNKYLGIIGATLQQVLAYRVMAISSIVANMFWIVILYSSGAPRSPGMTRSRVSPGTRCRPTSCSPMASMP